MNNKKILFKDLSDVLRKHGAYFMVEVDGEEISFGVNYGAQTTAPNTITVNSFDLEELSKNEQ